MFAFLDLTPWDGISPPTIFPFIYFLFYCKNTTRKKLIKQKGLINLFLKTRRVNFFSCLLLNLKIKIVNLLFLVYCFQNVKYQQLIVIFFSKPDKMILKKNVQVIFKKEKRSILCFQNLENKNCK